MVSSSLEIRQAGPARVQSELSRVAEERRLERERRTAKVAELPT